MRSPWLPQRGHYSSQPEAFSVRRCRALLRALLLALILAWPFTVSADEESNQALLSEINEKILSAEGRLRSLSSRQADLEAALKDLRSTSETLRAQEQNFRQQFEEKNNRRKALVAQMKQTAAEIERIRTFSLLRLRALYVNKSDLLVQRLFALGDQSRFSSAAFFLKRLKSFDAATLERLARLQNEQNQKQTELEEVLAVQVSLQAQIKSRREKIELKAQSQEGVLKELRNQKVLAQQVLLALRAQALRLETVVASLTGGETNPGVSNGGESRGSESVITRKGSFGAYRGRGLKSQVGELSTPVNGQIIERFGQKRSLGFEESMQSKGLEYNCLAETPVQAIAAGRVIFSGQMPRYGTVLIIDHGERSYTLYGRLGKVFVSAGDVVSTAEKIAVTGPADPDGHSFYFELREQGRAVNPQGYGLGL